MLLSESEWLPSDGKELEDNAIQAIKSENNVLLTASAGSGKTEILAQKAVYLLQTGKCPSPKKILAICFKKDAAKNLEERVSERCSSELSCRFKSITFDSFSKSLVDQFRMGIPEDYRPSENYDITFLNKDRFNEFCTLTDLQGIDFTPFSFSRSVSESLFPFPCNQQSIPDYLKKFWSYMYRDKLKTQLTFGMINRLAIYILMENEKIKKAIQNTYSHIFLDEFQDITFSQFQFLYKLFYDSNNQLTAVGDEKQKIMGFAGAYDKAFDRFRSLFHAVSLELQYNWRSNPELVKIQDTLVRLLGKERSSKTISKQKNNTKNVTVCQIWRFEDEQNEANTIADFIKKRISVGLFPSDFAILVRSLPDRQKDRFTKSLNSYGINLLNMAEIKEGVYLDDLLSDDLIKMFICTIKASLDLKETQCFEAVKNFYFQYNYSENEKYFLISRKNLSDFIKRINALFYSFSEKEDVINSFIDEFMLFFNKKNIQSIFLNHKKDEDLEKYCHSFKAFFLDAAEHSSDWKETINRFEGKDQVRLMTIHKSKGLEFDTTFFIGFDTTNWFSLKPTAEEELNALFVAFTRAKQFMFFSSSIGQRPSGLSWIETPLRQDGVEIKYL